MNWPVFFFTVWAFAAVVLVPAGMYRLACLIDRHLRWPWGGVIVFSLVVLGLAALVGMVAA